MGGRKYTNSTFYVDSTIYSDTTNPQVNNVYYTSTVTNNGKSDATEIPVSYEISTNNGASFTPFQLCGWTFNQPNCLAEGVETIPYLSKQGGGQATQKIYAALKLRPGDYRIRAHIDPLNTIPEKNDSDNYTGSGGGANVRIPPPPAYNPCTVKFDNLISRAAN